MAARNLPRRRTWSLLLVGVAIFAVSFLAISNAIARASDTLEVVAVDNPVQRGEVITAEDLTTAQVPEGESALDTVPVDRLNDLVGQVAVTALAPGSTLTPGSIAEGLTPPQGTSLVGLTMNVSQMPATPLTSGDTVRVVHTPDSPDAGAGEGAAIIEATVVSVTQAPQAGQAIVDVEVPSQEASRLATWAYSQNIVLILDAPE